MTRVTRQLAKEAILETEQVIKEWESADSPNVKWRGGSSKGMSGKVARALDELCSISNASQVDDDAKEIVMAVDRISTEFTAWAEAFDIAPESVHPTGTPDLWAAFRSAVAATVDVPRKLPEPIRELMEAGVSDQQICKIYGFLLPDGSGDVAKLTEEKREPGTHFDPETWVPPHRIRQLREINEQWESRSFSGHMPVENEQPKEFRPAPESLDDLIAQGVDGPQIAKMKGMTVEQVEGYAAKLGLPLAGRIIRSPEKQDDEAADLAKQRSELIPKSHPDISDLENRILACAIDGMKPADIATALQHDWPDLNWQKVSAIIKKLEREGVED